MIKKLRFINQKKSVVLFALFTAANLLVGLPACSDEVAYPAPEPEKNSPAKISEQEKAAPPKAESIPTPKKKETPPEKEKIVRPAPAIIETPKSPILPPTPRIETRREIVTETYDIPATQSQESPKQNNVVSSNKAERWSNHDPSKVGFSGIFTLYVVESKTIGQYQVLISWGKSNRGNEDNVYVERESKGSSQGNWTGLLSLDKGEHVDKKVVPGETYTYYFTLNSNPKYHQRHIATLHIPQDIVLDGIVRHPDLKGYRRVIFNKDAVVITGGARFEIEAEEIISDHGTIETFAPSDVASAGVDGFHGGEIKVSTKRAGGQLSIVAHGQETDAAASVKPVKGGDAARTTVHIDDSSRLHLRVSSRPGKGGGALTPGTDGEPRPVCLMLGQQIYGLCEKAEQSKGHLK